jgi:hypothetical protein
MAPASHQISASKHWETNEGPQPTSFKQQATSRKQQATSVKQQASSYKRWNFS